MGKHTDMLTARDRCDSGGCGAQAYVRATFLTGYFLVAASAETEDFGTGRTVYCFVTTDNQPAHISMGLLTYAQDCGEADDEE